MTVNDLIRLALYHTGAVGAGQDVTAEDSQDALSLLNMMIRQWESKRWLVYHLVDLWVGCNGQEYYTIGPRGNIDIAYRPDRIEHAYFRQTFGAVHPTGNDFDALSYSPSYAIYASTKIPVVSGKGNIPIDYPLHRISAREDYSNIPAKDLSSFPSCYFYDSDYPFGKIYVWPVPNGLYELHVVVRDVLKSFVNLTDDIYLPEEYQAALMYNLAVKLGPLFKMPVDNVVVQLAKEALNVLRMANTQIPVLTTNVGNRRTGNYNIYADQMRW